MLCGLPLYNSTRPDSSRLTRSLSSPPDTTPSSPLRPSVSESPTLQLLPHLSPTLSVPSKHTAVWRLVKTTRVLQLRANVILVFRPCDDPFSPSEAQLVLPLHSHSRLYIRIHRRSSVFVDGHIFFFQDAKAATTFLSAARDSIAVHCIQPQSFLRQKLSKSVSVKRFQKSDVFFSTRLLSAVLHQRLFLQAAFYTRSPFLPRLQCATETRQTLSFSIQSLPSFGSLTALLISLPNHRLPLLPARHLFAEMLLTVTHAHTLGFLLRDVTTDTFTITKAGHVILSYFGEVKLVTTHIPAFPQTHHSAPSFPSDLTPLSHLRPEPVSDDEVIRSLQYPTTNHNTLVDHSQPSTIASDLFDHDDPLNIFVSNDLNSDARAKSFVGTRSHMSPEHLSAGHATSGSYGFASDIWMLGVTLYTMVVGHHPFHDSLIDATKLFDAILSNDIHIPSSLPDDLATLLRGMLEKDERKRLTAQAIMSSPWVRHLNWSNLCASACRKSPVPMIVDLLPFSETCCSDVSSDESLNPGRLSRLSHHSAGYEGFTKKRISLPPFKQQERLQTIFGFDFFASSSDISMDS